MADKGADPERMENPLLNLMPAAWAGRETVRFDEFVNARTEILEKVQEANRQWLERAQSQANSASEFMSKLTAARSFPEAMAAYQEWTAREFQMIAQDGQRLFENTQKFMETGTRLFTGYLYAARHPAE